VRVAGKLTYLNKVLFKLKAKFKSKLRPLLAEITYYGYFCFLRRVLEVGRNGKPLEKGITAVVAAKNESYTISLCLRSLVGVVDQIVCIDNGSDDDTLQQMYEFQNEYGGQIEIEIISLPGALLGDCREAGLRATKYQWHLRWDADMVCKTSGAESMLLLREEVLANDHPRAIQLPRTNLFGDLHHTSKLYPVVDQGEPIMIRMSKHICYKEYGRFDTVRLPLYYRLVKHPKRFYFHCSELKSDVNLLHRSFYFRWRDEFNATAPAQRSDELKDLSKYRRAKELETYGTNDKRSLKYRLQRQTVYHYQRYEPELYGDYPDILREQIESGKERFKVIYRDGRPYLRVDYEDPEMLEHKPTQEDLDWDPEDYLRSMLSMDECRQLGVSPTPGLQPHTCATAPTL
jgi:glycosyltransferase involved in cell wall biosynthesis